MRYHVNENCIGCGLCTSVCSEVFSLTDAGVAVALRDAVPKELETAAMEAKESCPVAAIEQV